jgi:hypothetical protein
MPKELPDRRVWIATALMTALVIGSTVIASAAAFDFPILGFNKHSSASASDDAEMTPTTSALPVPVEQIEFDDHIVRRGPSANAGPGSASSDDGGQPSTSTPAPTADTQPHGDDVDDEDEFDGDHDDEDEDEDEGEHEDELEDEHDVEDDD